MWWGEFSLQRQGGKGESNLFCGEGTRIFRIEDKIEIEKGERFLLHGRLWGSGIRPVSNLLQSLISCPTENGRKFGLRN